MASNGVKLSGKTRDALDRNNLKPLWEIAGDHLGQTRENLEADIWKWTDIEATVNYIAEDVPTDLTPRVTVPVNARYPAGVSHTISVGVETAPPGDTTPAHRHNGHFLRFTIDGHSDMKTAVGGEEFPMSDNDLMTIPPWEWHGHGNEGDEETAWLVVDDSPLRIDTLKIGNIVEMYDDERQPITRPSGYHDAQYGNCRTPSSDDELPGPFEGTTDPTPPYRFRWADMSKSLEYAENDEDAWSQYDGTVARYTNPARGGGALFPTIGARAQRLPGGTETETHSHNATEIFFVIEGSGHTTVEGELFDWSDRDIFVVPTYKSHSHETDREATLLALTDRPLLEAINCYHEVEEEPDS